VPNDDELLKPGMTSTVSIEIERANNTLRVPAAALRFAPTDEVLKVFPAATVDEPAASDQPAARRRTAAVWQLVGGRLERVPVRAGVSDGTQVAITSDALDEGASIITGVARSEAGATATPAAGGSPLVPQMPRRAGQRQPQGR
jgi:HlyD family secretion protein